MGFRLLPSNFKQTAANAAATMTAALVTAGIVDTEVAAAKSFATLRDTIFNDLNLQVTEDNKTLESEEAKAPKTGGGGARRKPQGGEAPKGAGGDTVVSFGAFKGQTIAQIAAMSAAEAKEYGEALVGDGWAGNPYAKPGSKYVEYLAGSTKAELSFISAQAQSYLDELDAKRA